MHPYLVATVVVSVVVVGFVAYTVYNEILNEPIPVYSTARGNEDDDSEDSDSEKDSYFDPHNNKNTREERIGLRKRKRNTDKKSKDEKDINDSNEQEEQLLEKLSYLNVLEQELHRREKEIENEERILKEREQQLENRKQYFQSVSSKSSSNSDLSKNTNTSSHETNTRTNTSATNTILDNSSNDENSLSNDTVAVKSVVEQYTLVNESDLHPDAAQTILSQDLSNISGRHLQSSIDDAYNNNNNNNIITTNESDDNNRRSSIVNDEVMDTQQSQLHIFQETLDLPDDSRLLSPNHQSEDAWSEIGSIISENTESEMSSAVDIDMEEVDVIEH